MGLLLDFGHEVTLGAEIAINFTVNGLSVVASWCHQTVYSAETLGISGEFWVLVYRLFENGLRALRSHTLHHRRQILTFPYNLLPQIQVIRRQI